MGDDRKVLHVDMDAFYASVEQRDYPELRGKPVVVGGRPEQRGAVAAASYEARQFGIHSAMPSRTAAHKCKALIFVSPRFEVYREVSAQIRSIFQQYTDLVEPVALDEAYLDVTVNQINQPSAMVIAREIKRKIWEQTQLTASAGVSINKFLAKMASGLDKPNGLTLIAPDQAEAFVATLPIEKFHGVGKVTAAKMQALGIRTGTELKRWSEADLVQQFGKVGYFYYGIARGQDHRPVNPNRVRKSIGAEKSFVTDLDQSEVMLQELEQIAQLVHQRLQAHRRVGFTMTLKIKYADRQQVTRAMTVSDPLRDAQQINDLARRLLLDNIESKRKVRLLGLSISQLINVDAQPEHRQLALDLH